MINKEHSDYQEYKFKFEKIMLDEKEELENIKTQKVKSLDGNNSIIHKKYALKIKELQNNYKHLFIN